MARMSGAKKMTEFRLKAAGAKKVALAGDFNKWNTSSLIAKKDKKGNWVIKARLSPGKHEYKFYVDGNWMVDPNCAWRVPNAFGSENCAVNVK